MISLKGIEAVTFDVGGTLITPRPSVGHVYAEVAARHGCANISIDELNRRFARAWRTITEFDYTRQAWARIVNQTFEGLTTAASVSVFFPELYERFAQPDAWRIFDDVRLALESLESRELALGVISNWDDRLPPLLQSLELRKHFQAVIVSCEAGFRKPSRQIFECAAERLQINCQAILHVGDDYLLDFYGARKAGLRSVWLQRGCESRPPDQIASLRELIP